VRSGFSWLRIGAGGSPLWTWWWTELRFVCKSTFYSFIDVYGTKMLANHDIGTVTFQFHFTYLTVYYIFLMTLHKTKHLVVFPSHSHFFMHFYANHVFIHFRSIASCRHTDVMIRYSLR
jgi:hypothetical protein